MKESKEWAGWIPLSMILGCLLFCGFYWLISKHPVKVIETKTEIVYDITDPFTQDKVLDYMKQLHVKYPKVALAQMKLESANGTSKIFKENNNLYGMTHPSIRATTSLGKRNNHAYYSHWRQSVVDYALWQNFVSNAENLSSEQEWLNYIGRMYAEDNSYKKKIVVILDSLKHD